MFVKNRKKQVFFPTVPVVLRTVGRYTPPQSPSCECSVYFLNRRVILISGKGGVSSQRKPNDVFMLDSMKPLSKEEAKAPKKTSLVDYHGIELLGFFSP